MITYKTNSGALNNQPEYIHLELFLRIKNFLGKHAEAELIDLSDRLNALAAQNSALASGRRKLETDNEQLRAELEEALMDAKNADERAKKASMDVRKL